MRVNRDALIWQNTKTILRLLFGAPIVLIGGLYIVLCLTGYEATLEDDPKSLHVAFVCTCLFAFFFWRGCVDLALLLDLRKYRKAEESIRPESLEEFADAVGESPAKAEKTLARMNRLHLITGLPYRDPEYYTLSVSSEEQCEDESFEEVLAGSTEKEEENGEELPRIYEEKVTVTCPYCRGVSIITKGTQAPCDYCKKIIQG